MHHDIDAVGQGREQLRCRIASAYIQWQCLAAEACSEGVEVLAGLRYIQQQHIGAVPCQGFRNGGADTARSPCDQRTAAAEWAGPVLHLAGAGLQAQYLARDEGTLRREEEAQGAFQLIFGTGGDIQQLGSRAIAQFLGQ
ncbi:hypothetical protein D3C76_510920 [compost metagenome]